MDESLKYKWFYESLQRMDKALNISEGVDEMLDDVVETVLDIFQCDRAWLFHPCDPNADHFDVTAESNKPQYPGAKSQQVSVPMTPDMAAYCRYALDKLGEVMVDPLPGSEISNDIALRFSVQSLTFMALHPKVGDPWMFGMHQCDHPREWSCAEKTLFRHIGHRLQDALSNNLSLERVAASEKTLRQLASSSWEAIVIHEDGVPVLANDQYYTMFGYSPEEILGRSAMEMTTTPGSLRQMRRLIAAGEYIPYEAVGVRKDGSTFPMEIKTRRIGYQGKDLRVAAIRDVTKYKRVEEDLRSSQEQLRAIFDSASDFVFLKDGDHRYVKVNPAMERLFDRPAQKLEWRTDRELFGDETGKHIEELDARVLRGETLEEEDTKPVNGKLHTFHVKKTPVYGIDGKVIGLCGIARDVTERKQAEQALRESELRFRVIAELAPVGIVISDKQDKALYVSPKYTELFGYTIEDTPTVNEWMVLAYPDRILRERVQSEWAFAMDKAQSERTEIAPLEYPVTCKDGNTRQVEFRMKSSGSLNVTMLTDVTQRKKMEDALRKSEARLRTIFDVSKAGIILVDPEGVISFANQGIADMLGLTLKELIGSSYTEHVHPTEKKIGDMKMRQLIAGEIDSVLLERLYLRSDGTDFIGLLSGRRHEDEQGKLISLVGIISDISDQKRLESQLAQAQKMEAIGTLAGGIAHEFNNMLSIVIGNTELALDDIPDWSPVAHCIQEILAASLRAKDVVRKLLSVARKSPTSRKPIQIRPIIKESLDLMRKTIPATIDIRQNISCSAEIILGDATEISQVVINLCNNSFHAIGEQKGVLEVDLETIQLDSKPAIRYENLNSGNYAKLTVRDSGHGIKPELIDRIFDPYFTTKDVDEGLGMGLAVVHSIVKKHDGAIKISSEIGKGTTVEVLFPLIEEQEVVSDEGTDTPPVGTERILFVDDESSLVKMVTQMLERSGYEVIGKTNSIDALKVIEENPGRFDLVITDMAMPDMSGDRLAQEIVRVRPNVPIILCTGHSDYMDEKKAMELGIRCFAMKPLTKSDLTKTVRRVLDEAKR